jgi:hypothetical protein
MRFTASRVEERTYGQGVVKMHPVRNNLNLSSVHMKWNNWIQR